ncbi:MAG: type II toxin-antitoxin system VapC family toxin [Caldilineaceae bacterium]
MIIVLDACAMIAYLRSEEGAEIIEELLVDDEVVCYAHAINICEVYYNFLRVSDEETAFRAIQDLQNCGLQIREDMDSGLWQAAGVYKATQQLSLADCFALVLSLRLGAELVTSDHHEFGPIQESGLCSIRFFR